MDEEAGAPRHSSHCAACKNVESYAKRYREGRINRPLPGLLGLLLQEPQAHELALLDIWDSMRNAREDARSLEEWVMLLECGMAFHRVSFSLVVRCLASILEAFRAGKSGSAAEAFSLVTELVATVQSQFQGEFLEALAPWFRANCDALLESPQATDLRAFASDCVGLPATLGRRLADACLTWIIHSGSPVLPDGALAVFLATSKSLPPDDRFTAVFRCLLPTLADDSDAGTRHLLANEAVLLLEDPAQSLDLLAPGINLLLSHLSPFDVRVRLAYVERLDSVFSRLAPDARAEFILFRVAWAMAVFDMTRVSKDIEFLLSLDQSSLPADTRASILRVQATLLFRVGDLEAAVGLTRAALDMAEAPRLKAALRAELATHRALLAEGTDQAAASISWDDIPLPAALAMAHAQALLEFSSGRLDASLLIVNSALARDQSSRTINVTYSRRRLQALKSAVLLLMGKPEEALRGLLIAVDEIADSLRRNVAGTERKSRARRLEEAEMLLDLSLQIVAASPTAHSVDDLEELWLKVAIFRDIEMEFHSAANQAAHRGDRIAKAYFAEVRHMSSLLHDGLPPGTTEQAGQGVVASARKALYDAEVAASHLSIFREYLQARLSCVMKDVREKLDGNVLLVDFVRYWSGRSDSTGRAISGLIAFVITGKEPASVVLLLDSRSVTPIEGVAQYLANLDLHIPDHSDLEVADEDMVRVLKGLIRADPSIQRVALIPDGPIRRLNLASLPSENTYLDENVTFTHLGSILDLIASDADAAGSTNAMVLAFSEFGEVQGNLPHSFPPLPAAQLESVWVSDVLESLTGKKTLVSSSGSLGDAAARYLHIASHGFFSEGPELGSLILDDVSSAYLVQSLADRPRLDPSRLLDASMRSGLALRHANTWLAGHTNASFGILTAADIMGMDLHGTVLAVLSGCRTADGTIRRYEGAVDLRRSLQVAGVGSVILAVRNVPDSATAVLMRLVWSHVGTGSTPAQALRRAQMQLRETTVADLKQHLDVWPAMRSRYLEEIGLGEPTSRPFAHPYFWSGFVCYSTH